MHADLAQTTRRRLSATVRFAALLATQLGGCGGPTSNSPGDVATTESDDGAPAGTFVADQLIALSAPGASDAELAALFQDLGTTVRERLSTLSATLLQVDPARRDEVRERLAASPLIEELADNRVFEVGVEPADPAFAIQWHLEAIRAPQAWEYTTGDADVLVAVIDTGVDSDHPDLRDKLRQGANTADGATGWQDRNGHGTAVAGVLAAATNNQIGVTGVAPASPILPVRVTDEVNHATSWAVAGGIAFAVNAGAKVINVSIDSMQDDPIVLRQVQAAWLAGALVVFASGNTGLQMQGGGSAEALFVGAVVQDLQPATFSTYGEFVDLAAPGAGIYTTQLDNTYGLSNGTSFAAPMVSGVAALIWSIKPELRPSTVRAILLETAVDVAAAGEDVRVGAGLLNAGAAIELALSVVDAPDTAAPSVSIRRPADGAAVSGVVVVELAVSDDSDIADVALLVDDVPVAIDNIAPYAFRINSGLFARGRHRLTAIATDLAGNAAQTSIDVSISGSSDSSAPTLTLLSPADGASVRGVATVLVSAADEALASAELLVDGQSLQEIAVSGAEARLAFTWDSAAASVSAGPHRLRVRALDQAGNAAELDFSLNVLK